MRIAFSETALPTQGALAVGVLQGRVLTASAEKIDKATGGALRRAMKAGRFKGGAGQAFDLIGLSGTRLNRVIVYGLGKASDLTDIKLEALGGRMVKRFNAAAVTTGTIAVDPVRGGKLKTADMAARVAMGARLGSYRFDRYRTKEPADKKPTLRTLTVTTRAAVESKGKICDIPNIPGSF
jgi:leucyl aminopeptidase